MLKGSINKLLPSLILVFCVVFSGIAQQDYKIENLPFIENGDPNDPAKNRDLEYYNVSDLKNKSEIRVRVTNIGSCGMERKAGLQLNVSLNKLGEIHGFCVNSTSYTLMQMLSEKSKEKRIIEASIANADSSVRFDAYLVTSPKIQVKTVLKQPSMKEPLIKMYDLPFTYVPFEKRSPEVIQVVKELFKENEIDQFKIEDISGDRYLVRVVGGTCGMDRKPCLSFYLGFNGLTSSENNTFITEKSLQDAGASGKKIILKTQELKSKNWGPGKHHYTITVDKTTKKATIAITTNTTSIPLERTYALPF